MAVGPNALCTLDDVKNYYGMETSSVEIDALIESLIDRVSKQFEMFCDRVFVSTNYIQYYDGNKTSYLFVDQYPITTVSGVWDDTDWVWGSDTQISGTDYRVADDNHIVFNATILTKGDQNVKVAYTAGYATIPYDLVQACVEEVLVKYKRRSNVEIRSKTLPDGSVVYADSGSGGGVRLTPWKDSTTETLMFYKRKYAL